MQPKDGKHLIVRHATFLLLTLVVFVPTMMARPQEPIPGIGPVGPIIKVLSGFRDIEGLAVDSQSNVYFSDVLLYRISKVDTQGQLSTFMSATEGIIGLAFDGRSLLFACQGALGRLVTIDVTTNAVRIILDRYQGRSFNEPHDLVVDRNGGVYFTDPFFDLFDQDEFSQDTEAVYYLGANRILTRLIDNLINPTGIKLSPDEKTLYVLHAQPTVMAYPVTGPGQIGMGRVLAQLTQPGPGYGLTVDANGNLYVTRPDSRAIEVITPTGESLGLIQIPERPSNCAFGGVDLKTLYITSETSLYAAQMEATGYQFGTSGQPVVKALADSQGLVSARATRAPYLSGDLSDRQEPK